MDENKTESFSFQSLLAVLFILAAVFILQGCQDDGPATDGPGKISGSTVYEVAAVSDMSYGSVQRFVWHVLVHEPVTPKDLRLISEELVETAKLQDPFNALSLMYYDHEAFIGRGYVLGHGYTLGRADFAPNGDLTQATSVDPGDYGPMSFTWHLRTKDWSQQLTPEEAEVWAAWADAMRSFHENYDGEDDVEEEDVYNAIAARFDLDPDEVYAIVQKQYAWMMQDESS